MEKEQVVRYAAIWHRVWKKSKLYDGLSKKSKLNVTVRYGTAWHSVFQKSELHVTARCGMAWLIEKE